jgi:2-oxoglutarate dehydrogenase E2 component (dihydrolipoamide succinyltransferase)
MAQEVEVVIPSIGESVSEGTIGRWFFKEGDLVQKDQPLLEVDSDKATLEVPASTSGKLIKILVPAGKTAAVGARVALIDASAESGTAQTSQSATASVQKTSPESKPEPRSTPISHSLKESPKEMPAPSGPAAKESNVVSMDLKGFSPSKRKAIREGHMPAPQPGGPASFLSTDDPREVRKPLSTIRKRIAERLLESQQTTATLTTFNEVDMSRAMELRKQLKDQFEKSHGVKLGFMSFFSKAVIYALQEYPDVNARMEGDEIVYPQFVNLGIAVSTERGLVVPVVKDAQSLSFAGIESKMMDLAERARVGKLQIAEMQGGTFTVTNGGVFGSLLSTPIINPPQSGILGMHKIEHRPIAREKAPKSGEFTVEVKPMMYIALSYDHRLIDGATSVGFLVKVKEYLESVVTEAMVMA